MCLFTGDLLPPFPPVCCCFTNTRSRKQADPPLLPCYMLNTAGLSWGGEAEEGDSTSAAATAQVRTTLSHAPPPHKLSLLHMPPSPSFRRYALLEGERGRGGGREGCLPPGTAHHVTRTFSFYLQRNRALPPPPLPSPFALSFSTLPFCSFPSLCVCEEEEPFP